MAKGLSLLLDLSDLEFHIGPMKIYHQALLAVAFSSLVTSYAAAEDIKLPDPVRTGGTSLNNALNDRKSTREFGPGELSMQQLSNLLWAANGINREDGKRTAPSALNAQEIELYVLLKSGGYFYDPVLKTLKQVIKEDIRNLARGKGAPVEVLLVADLDKQNRHISGIDSGFVSQNIYLHCAGEGYATYVRGSFDDVQLQKKLSLPDTKVVMLAQSVGFMPRS